MWEKRGFCDVTSDGEGVACSATDNLGSWRLPYREGVPLLSDCLSKCAGCTRCRYVSVSRLGHDCSWFRTCRAPQTGDDLPGYRQKHFTYQVRTLDGTLHPRAVKEMARGGNATLDELGFRVVDVSSDAVCFGARCVSWASAFAATRGPDGWIGALPPPASTRGLEDCGLPAGCPFGVSSRGRARGQRRGCGRCANFDGTAGPRFNLSLAWSPRRGGLEAFGRWRARVQQHASSRGSARHRPRGAVTGRDRAEAAWPSSVLREVEAAGIYGPARGDGRLLGWTPTIVQSLHTSGAFMPPGFAPLEGAPIGPLPCSSARYEDGVVVRSFFVRADGRPLRGGTFLEMGAYDGDVESTTWYLEGCLGWRGILVEAAPRSFARLLEAPRATLNLRLAACAAHGHANFSVPDAGRITTASGVVDLDAGTDAPAWAAALVSVQCGPVGDYLQMLHVARIDFLSLDVEGAELVALQGLNLGQALSIGVLLVEVRADGQRPELLQMLLHLGLTYVGQVCGAAPRHASAPEGARAIYAADRPRASLSSTTSQVHGRPTQANLIIDDVYVNETHMRQHFPDSAALSHLGAAAP